MRWVQAAGQLAARDLDPTAGAALPIPTNYHGQTMGRRRPTDWIDWLLYRRAWVPAAAAFVLVLATSFQPDPPANPPQPAGFSAADAAAVGERAQYLDTTFPDRRPGTSGSADSAQWVRNQFRMIRDQFQGHAVRANVASGTTTVPGRREPISIMNVEAEIPGRTNELVVVYAPRDTSGRRARGSDAGSTAALLMLAEQIAASPDRKRSYLFVSTDAASSNGAGARLLAERVRGKRSQIIAMIGLSGIGQGREIRVPFGASDGVMPPLGLVVAARAASSPETSELPGIASQLVRLGVPLTRYEHGQLLRHGLPAVTLTATSGARRPDISEAHVVTGMNTVLNLLASIDASDTLQSAGKTYVISGDRVLRGWALKIFLVTLLIPAWAVAARALVRHRKRLALAAALGSVARGMMVGLWGVAMLWLFAALGMVPSSSDIPPASSLMSGLPGIGLVGWALLLGSAWVLSRGPDWRRAGEPGVERATSLVAVAALVGISVAMLAANPYAVLFLVPVVHAWIWLVSRHAYGSRRWWIFAVGGTGPALGLISVEINLHVPVVQLPVYVLDLIATRSLPAAMGMLIGLVAGCAATLAVALAGRTGTPLLIRLREAGFGRSSRFHRPSSPEARPRVTPRAIRSIRQDPRATPVPPNVKSR